LETPRDTRAAARELQSTIDVATFDKIVFVEQAAP
jgi:hypothetical protein